MRKSRRAFREVRAKVSPLLSRWYGTYGNAELEIELGSNLPQNFEILMVHSSISNMQPMYHGTPQDLLDLLLQLVGPQRTLAMPAFFFGSPEYFNRAYYRKHPQFDVRRTPSQMGLVTELFRRRSGTIRSLHPTHSVAASGPLAEKICATHHLSPWGCGDMSPFGIMGRHKTVIIGLGVKYYRSLTQVHSMEERLGSRFPVPRDEREELVRVRLLDKTGTAFDYTMSSSIASGFVLKAERLKDFVEKSDIKEWTYKGTTLYVTEASKVDAAIERAAMRGETLYAPA